MGLTLQPRPERQARERLARKRQPYQAAAARNRAAGVRSATVLLTPVGLGRGVQLTALTPQEHKVNYFIGNDPKKWVADVPTYQAVVYREAYQGIDLKFYGQGRQLEYDVIVRPGGNPNQVKFRYAGIQRLEVTKEGDLALHLPGGGVLLQKKPYIYQEIAGVRVAREGKFRLEGDTAAHTYGFEVAAYDQAHPLVIDPKLDYSTYWGAARLRWANALPWTPRAAPM